ncbi:MAG: hypothetical protein SOZ12_01320 [Anaerotignum sp.]|nr:hypothetical protein [Anaerotignum sp.]MDY3925959.1 hypothetical protein [Anaerotignum sp.]
MLNDLSYNLLLTILSAAILKGISIIWKYINSTPNTTPALTTAKLKRTRKQFLCSLFLLIACTVTFIKDYHPYLNFIVFVMAGFLIVILWGAFDAVYFPLYEIVEEHPQKDAEKSGQEVK